MTKQIPVTSGHWVWVETVVPANGDETKLLILSGTPLGPGNFTLRFVLDRDRWPVSTGADPEQHDHDQADLTPQW